jgi:hypothetical protein
MWLIFNFIALPRVCCYWFSLIEVKYYYGKCYNLSKIFEHPNYVFLLVTMLFSKIEIGMVWIFCMKWPLTIFQLFFVVLIFYVSLKDCRLFLAWEMFCCCWTLLLWLRIIIIFACDICYSCYDLFHWNLALKFRLVCFSKKSQHTNISSINYPFLPFN